jgi:unsaturated rhamnogalacturonyl hydrolase
MDQFVNVDGSIHGYEVNECNLAHLNNGKAVLDLYEEFGEEKYKKAADLLYSQFNKQPRLNDETFWHKKIYPYQCWLDGLYMGSVFYARYQKLFNISKKITDAAMQFVNAYKNTVDDKVGLCYHIYDETKKQPWATFLTGHSPHFWLRAMAWFLMSMVDVLEYFPQDLPERKTIASNLEKLLLALIRHADSKTGLWYQIVDEGDRIGNYLEASGSFMVLAAIAKSLRLNYVKGGVYEKTLDKGWQNAIEQFLTIKYFTHDLSEATQWVNVNKICQMADLGGKFPSRDGSFAYYIETPIVANDHKGYGAFLLASAEMLRRKKV